MYPSIVYMGTPYFAVPPLLALHENGFKLPLVVTQPDRPKGRGRVLTAPPVKQAALSLGCRVIQPPKVRDPEVAAQIESLAPDFLVVVAFGQILPSNVLKIPKYGAINVHGSLLPKYRGPAPVQWAMIRGEKETGITTILMDTGVDTGDMLLKAKTTIRTDETAAQLHHRLAHLGASVLIDTITQLWQGTLFPRAQKNDDASYAPALKKEDGHINWHQTAERLHTFVRAMTPWPGAYCFWGNKRLKILKTRPIGGCTQKATPGMVVESFPDELRVAVEDGVLLIEEIQSQSGRRMAAKDFLRGNPLAPGEVLK